LAIDNRRIGNLNPALAGCHAALLGFPTMPTKRRTAHLVMAFAWATHALSWFLPAFRVFSDSDSVRGWVAFGVALSPMLDHQSVHGDPWYYSVLSVASAVTTLMFVVGSPLAVWRRSNSVQRACTWVATTAFVVNSHWYVFRYWVSREDLSVGYFLWWLSFGLLAVGLFLLSSHTTGIQYRHVTQTEAQEPT